MSSEIGLIAAGKWLIGVLAAGLVVAWGWIAKDHSDRLKGVESNQEDLNTKLLRDYHTKTEMEKHIALVMYPIIQRLDDMNKIQTQVLEELKKLNERVVRVETKQK